MLWKSCYQKINLFNRSKSCNAGGLESSWDSGCNHSIQFSKRCSWCPNNSIAITYIIAGAFEKNNLSGAIFTSLCGVAEIGQAIVKDTRIALVSFTGSSKDISLPITTLTPNSINNNSRKSAATSTNASCLTAATVGYKPISISFCWCSWNVLHRPSCKIIARFGLSLSCFIVDEYGFPWRLGEQL